MSMIYTSVMVSRLNVLLYKADRKWFVQTSKTAEKKSSCETQVWKNYNVCNLENNFTNIVQTVLSQATKSLFLNMKFPSLIIACVRWCNPLIVKESSPGSLL